MCYYFMEAYIPLLYLFPPSYLFLIFFIHVDPGPHVHI